MKNPITDIVQTGMRLDIRLLPDILVHTKPSDPTSFYVGIAKAILKGQIRYNRFIRPQILSYHVVKFLIDPNVGLGASLYLRYYEPNVFREMNNSSGELFLDIGANVGAYSLTLAKNFKKVISVEPSPVASLILLQNIELNELRNVMVVQKGIFSYSDRFRFYHHDELINWSFSNQSANFDEIDTTTIDELCSSYDKIDLVKIDVEGAELEAIKGASSSFSKISKLVIEVREKYEKPIIAILKSYGFSLYCLQYIGIAAKKSTS